MPAAATPAPVSFNGISGAAALTLWAMLGFECAAVPAQRVRDPERNIPRATILGTLLVGLIYFTAFVAIYLLLPGDLTAKSSAPFADLATHYWGPVAGTLVVIFAAISCLGALNGWVLIVGDIPLALAERGVFPRWFAKLNRKGMPVGALILGAVLSCGLIAANYTRGLTELYGFMALLATVATLVLYLVCALARFAPHSAWDAAAWHHDRCDHPRPDLRRLDALWRRVRGDGVGRGADRHRPPGLLAHALARRLQPAGGGESSRASGTIRLSFFEKLRRHTSLVPSGPAT